MPRLGVISDLHLDFYKTHQIDKILENIRIQAAEEGIEVLVNAGDIANGYSNIGRNRYFDMVHSLDNVYHILCPGNHDFYRESLMKFERTTEILGKKFAASTLWTDCHEDPAAELYFMNCLNDSRLIYGLNYIHDMKELHYSNREFLLTSQADVVVSHNPPSMLSVTEQYRQDLVGNKAFIPNMDNQVCNSGIPLWIHGHVHSSHDYVLGDTRVVANPLGYPKEIYKDIGAYRVKIIDI